MVDVTGRGLPTGALARRGVVAFLVVTALVAVMLLQYRGVFRSVFPAVAVVADVGDGVQPGADVKLRGTLVGSVAEVRVRPVAGRGVLHEIELQLQPRMAAGIPAGVTARVVPTNVFGAPSVELLDPARPTGQTLARGATIPGDTSQATLQLQTVLTELNKVLRAVRPAELNVALTNVAQGLRGRGGRLGSIVARLDPYLTTLNRHNPEFSDDLRLLGTDLDALATAAPDLLDMVDNAVVTSQTIVAKRERLVATLTGARDAAGDLDDFLSDNDDRIIRLVRDGSGIAHVLAPQHRLITSSLFSLASAATRLSSAANPRTGGGLSLVFSLTPFAPYTSADCPRYPGRSGPNCGTPSATLPPGFPFYQAVPSPPPLLPDQPPANQSPAGSRDRPQADAGRSGEGLLPGMFPTLTPSSYQTPGGAVGPVGSPAEARTIQALLGDPGSGAAGVLLAGPILRGATVVIAA